MQHFKAAPKYEIKSNEQLGRYLVAAKDLKAGEKILSDEPFVLGPSNDTALVCFNCYLPLISKFVVCKNCAVAPICPGDGCPEHMHNKWHSEYECETFRTLKLTKGLHPMTMVQNVGSLLFLRAILKRKADPQAWEEFMALETHLDKRKGTDVWEFYENTVQFIEALGLLDDVKDKSTLIQKVCGAVDVNSFEVRGPPIPAIGCSEILRGVYLKAALLAHNCIPNTHISINDNNLFVCHASVDIEQGDIIYNNYTDPLKGTSVRQQHLLFGKYFKCSCNRCKDSTEMGTFMSSILCPECKKGYVTEALGMWQCSGCNLEFMQTDIGNTVQSCLNKFRVINKKDEKELEEFIRNVSQVLAPNHYVLLEAKQRLAGVLRDTINREPRPTKKLMKRKMELCNELLPVLDKLCPGISRTKAITLYELHAAMVQLAKKLFDGRELTGSGYMDELLSAEKFLKQSLEMLFIEPGNSPEGELCAKALEEYKALKVTMSKVLDGLHADGTTYIADKAERDKANNGVPDNN